MVLCVSHTVATLVLEGVLAIGTMLLGVYQVIPLIAALTHSL